MVPQIMCAFVTLYHPFLPVDKIIFRLCFFIVSVLQLVAAHTVGARAGCFRAISFRAISSSFSKRNLCACVSDSVRLFIWSSCSRICFSCSDFIRERGSPRPDDVVRGDHRLFHLFLAFCILGPKPLVMVTDSNRFPLLYGICYILPHSFHILSTFFQDLFFFFE